MSHIGQQRSGKCKCSECLHSENLAYWLSGGLISERRQAPQSFVFATSSYQMSNYRQLDMQPSDQMESDETSVGRRGVGSF